MTRPNHLSVPNTPEGIRRINDLQRSYDENPDAYEELEQKLVEERMMEEEMVNQELQRQLENDNQ